MKASTKTLRASCVFAVQLWCAATSPRLLLAEQSAAVNYDRQILPIFSDNCYKCHGPDEAARKAHLRLDTKEGAFSVIKGSPIISHANPAGSELIRRIT